MKDQFGNKIEVGDFILVQVNCLYHSVGKVHLVVQEDALAADYIDVEIYGEMYFIDDESIICRLPKQRRKREQMLMKYQFEGMIIE